MMNQAVTLFGGAFRADWYNCGPSSSAVLWHASKLWPINATNIIQFCWPASVDSPSVLTNLLALPDVERAYVNFKAYVDIVYLEPLCFDSPNYNFIFALMFGENIDQKMLEDMREVIKQACYQSDTSVHSLTSGEIAGVVLGAVIVAICCIIVLATRCRYDTQTGAYNALSNESAPLPSQRQEKATTPRSAV